MIARQMYQGPETGSITYGSYQRDAATFSREKRLESGRRSGPLAVKANLGEEVVDRTWLADAEVTKTAPSRPPDVGGTYLPRRAR